MRLDVFLKLSRLISKRTLAKEYTKAGQVSVNGNIAKSSYSVKEADIIAINRRNSTTTVKVTKVPVRKQVSKKSAGELYELLAQVETDPLTE